MSQWIKWAMVGVFSAALMTAVAQEDKAAEAKAAPQKSVWQKMDANNDGEVTVAEHQARVKDRFKELDANGDDKLTPDEFAGQRLATIDINKNDTVTLEEYIVYYAGPDAAADTQTVACDKLDVNSDQVITLVEFIAYLKSVFETIDSNNTGVIFPSEMKDYTNKRFKECDVDKDDFVTVEEMVAVIVPAAATPKAEDKKDVEKKNWSFGN